MAKQWIPTSIGKSINSKIIRGRVNVPIGDSFAWWSCHYEYKNNKSDDIVFEDL